MLSSFSTLNSIAKFSNVSSAPSGPTQSYGGAFTHSIQHTSPASARYLSTTLAQSIGTNRFTIEFWCFIPSTSTAGIGLFGNRYQNNVNQARLHCWFNFGSNNQTIWLFNIVGGTGTQFLQTGTVTTNQWNHIAFTRDASNVCRCFVNGVLQPNTRTWATNFNLDNQWAIGRAYHDLNQEYLNANGRLTGFSISNECYYITSFTPTRQRLNNDATKLLLLNFTGSTLTDSSSSNNTITNNGTMGFSTDVPV
jgi:hypothetical protein